MSYPRCLLFTWVFVLIFDRQIRKNRSAVNRKQSVKSRFLFPIFWFTVLRSYFFQILNLLLFLKSKNPWKRSVYKDFLAPRTGLEPVTLRLTAGCSTIELSRNTFYSIVILYFYSLHRRTSHSYICTVKCKCLSNNLRRRLLLMVPSKLHIKLSADGLSFALISFFHFIPEQAPRPISTGQLQALLLFHLRPISS